MTKSVGNIGPFSKESSQARQKLKRAAGAVEEGMVEGQCIKTHAGIPQQCLGWMNRKEAAPSAMREKKRDKG